MKRDCDALVLFEKDLVPKFLDRKAAILIIYTSFCVCKYWELVYFKLQHVKTTYRDQTLGNHLLTRRNYSCHRYGIYR